MVKLKLPASIKIYLVVNISRVERYKKIVEEQKVKETKPIKVDRAEKWEVEKILSKQKIRKVVKYLVQWKRFMAEHNTWKKQKDLKNTKKAVAKFEKRISTKVRW